MKHHLQFDLEFVKNTYGGKYYALEGIDGSGKTTQVEKLADYFKKKKQEVFITKEPGEDAIGQLIKQVLSKKEKIPAISLQYLFAAERALHIQNEIIPALQKGKTVLTHRSFWSALAYGIADLDLKDNEKERLVMAYNILSLYGGFLVPDKTFIIDVPGEIAVKRIEERHIAVTYYEHLEMLKKVRENYIWMGKKFKEALIIIDGTKSKVEVFQEIIEGLESSE